MEKVLDLPNICYLQKNKKYWCKKCDYITCDKSNMKKHINTIKHKTTATKSSQKVLKVAKLPEKYFSAQKYYCEVCDYYTSKYGNYTKHLCTQKHIAKAGYFSATKYPKSTRNHNQTIFSRDTQHKNDTMDEPMCDTTHDTIHHSIQNNQLICDHITNDNVTSDENADKNRETRLETFVKTLLEQNNTLTNCIQQTMESQNKIICDMAKQPHIIQTNNTSFNIMNYLNNDCKEALNLTDFIKNVTVSYDDLLNIRKNGYIYGMEKTFVDELINLEEKKRPIQCTDSKRKKFFIKDDETWNIDNDNKRLNEALNDITSRHIHELQQWKLRNPDWMDNDKKFDIITDITCQILQGSSSNGEKFKKKIIDTLSKVLKINK